MNKLLTVFLALGAVCFTASAQKDTIRVLAIGNSFSEDCVEQDLYGISKAAGGPELIIGNMYIGGCTIQRHWKTASQGLKDYQYRKIAAGERTNRKGCILEDGLMDEPWDYISVNQGHGQYGLYDSYFPEIDSLLNFVREKALKKDFKLLINQIWSFPQATSRVSYMRLNYGNSTEKMYQCVVDASRRIAGYAGAYKVVPVGTAIWNLRHTWDRDNCYRDGFHLNRSTGRYTAACAWYEILTGRSCIGNSYLSEYITPERAEVSQHCAHAAVLNPDSLSDCGYRDIPVNYDEAKVPSYVLPDALATEAGRKVRNVREWEELRRPEILGLFEKEVYGKAPGRPDGMRFETLYTKEGALGGLAVRREVKVHFKDDGEHYMTLLIYAPAGRKNCPAFMGINFNGNETVNADPEIRMPERRQVIEYGIHAFKGRGSASNAWLIEETLKRGYAVVTFCRDDVDPDTDDAFGNGVHPLFYRKGQHCPAADEWGTIAAWAWGLSRALDYLETDELIDAKRVAVIGHSRLGKTALWAAATDRRFAMCISNCSGCGGAALSRRAYGETVTAINRHFPHWFCRNFLKYNDNESALPVDQHELLDLIAPRPLYVASGSEDSWADPVGEGLAAKEAAKVYRLYRAENKIGRHVHEGKHGIGPMDWPFYLDFADKWLK